MTYGQGSAVWAPSTAARRPRQHAVVFSGNGYNAAYEAGVLKALLHGVSPATYGERIQPQIYTGTSVGSYNAAFMASLSDQNDIAAAEKLEQTWHAGVTPRFRANPFDLLNPTSYWPNPLAPFAGFGRDAIHLSRDLVRRAGDLFASVEPTRPLTALREQILDYEWDILADITPTNRMICDNIAPEGIRKSAKKLRITAANWKKGNTTTFENTDFTDDAAHQIIMAAMAIPGILPRQHIGLEEYVDGAMLMEHPLRPAIEARDRTVKDRLTLHVIYLDPEFEQGTLMDARGSVAIVYRLFLLAFSRSLNADIAGVERLNRSVKFLELLRDFDPESEVMKLWSRLNEETRGAVEIEVHRYRSSKHFGNVSEIFIGMSKERLKHLIDTGYTDTRLHNCKESGCVLISEE